MPMTLKMAGSEIKMMLELIVAINTPSVAFESAIHLYRSCAGAPCRACSRVPLALPSIAMRFHSISPVLSPRSCRRQSHLVIVLVYYRATLPFTSMSYDRCYTPHASGRCSRHHNEDSAHARRTTTSHLRHRSHCRRSCAGHGHAQRLLLQPGRHTGHVPAL